MSSLPMPRDLSEEAVAEWLHNIAAGSNPGMQVALRARAVRALVEREVARERASTREKVREAVALDRENSYAEENRYWEGPASVKNELTVNAIVSRVMGDQPSNASGGQGAEGDQVTRG